jgi:hypothetical protein
VLALGGLAAQIMMHIVEVMQRIDAQKAAA